MHSPSVTTRSTMRTRVGHGRRLEPGDHLPRVVGTQFDTVGKSEGAYVIRGGGSGGGWGQCPFLGAAEVPTSSRRSKPATTPSSTTRSPWRKGPDRCLRGERLSLFHFPAIGPSTRRGRGRAPLPHARKGLARCPITTFGAVPTDDKWWDAGYRPDACVTTVRPGSFLLPD